MPRVSSYKQEFIKHYARLVYGEQAKSNALSKKERAIIKNLFGLWKDTDKEMQNRVHYLILQYIIWLPDNWKVILARERRYMQPIAELNKPSHFLLSLHIVQRYMYHAEKGKRLYFK